MTTENSFKLGFGWVLAEVNTLVLGPRPQETGGVGPRAEREVQTSQRAAKETVAEGTLP